MENKSLKPLSSYLSTFLGIILSVAIAETAGIICSFFTVSSISTWYAFLEKPSFSPPNWLFAPVWAVLYALMGIAAYLVFKNREHLWAKKSLFLYSVHLVLNALWSIIFFGMKNPGLAFLEILILWLLILIVAIKFFKIEKIAGILFIPYILWVTFAAILNFSIWLLN